MYGRIARYLLQDRDQLRGIELQFTYVEKAEILEAIARFAFENDLNVIEYDRLVDSLGHQPDKKRLVDLLAEIVRRSNILVRVGPTSFDFTHWTLREFFAAQGWDRQKRWKAWDGEEFGKYFSHESVPKFLVGLNPGERSFIEQQLSRCLEGNPLAAPVTAKVMLEVFSDCSPREQLTHLDNLVSSSLASPVLDVAEAGSLLSQMFHSAAEKDPLRRDLVDRLNALVARPSKENVIAVARLLGLCSMVPDEPIARSVCALLASSHGELEDPIRLCLAKMGPRVAGSCVRDIVKEKGDLGLSRTCMINSPDWTEQFEAQIEKWLADDDSPPDQEAILGRWLQLAGLAGPADEIERFRTALRGLMRRIFGVAPGPEHDAESVDRIYLTIGRGHASSLQKAWFSCMSNEDITDLSEGMGEIFRIIADVEKIDVRVDRKASQRAESAYKPPRNDVIDLLRDAADSASVRILLGLAARDEPRLRASVTDAVGILLSRFGNYIPSDLTDLGRQVVDDLWVFAHPGESLPAEFRGVKEQRAKQRLS